MVYRLVKPKEESKEESTAGKFRLVQPGKKPISKGRSVAHAAIKGLMRGTQAVAELADPLQTVLRFASGGRDLKSQLLSRAEEKLPSEEGFLEDVVGRTVEIAPSLALGGGSVARNLVQSLLMGTGGAVAKKLGAGKFGQTVAEIGAGGLPALGRRIIPNAAQRVLTNFGRRMGLTEAQIAPAIQSQAKQRFLGGLATKSPRIQRRLARSRAAIGRVFETLRGRPESQRSMTPQQFQTFANELAEVGRDLPYEVRRRAYHDAQDMVREGLTGASIINFWQDLNQYIPRGARGLGRFKEPLRRALERLSPELAQDFEMTNRLFTGISGLQHTLRPTVATQLLSDTKLLQVAGAFLTGSWNTLKTVLGVHAAKKIAANMLTSPRYQNLTSQIIRSLNQGKYAAANRIKDSLAQKIKKDNPKFYRVLKEIDFKHLPTPPKEKEETAKKYKAEQAEKSF